MSLTPHQAISLSIQELQAALLGSHPTMPSLLASIFANLKQDGDIVTLLEPAEVAILVSGLEVQTKTKILESKVVKKEQNKKLAQVSLDDI